MKLTATWNDKMRFTAHADQHSVPMDSRSPLGSDSALTPKQLVVAGLTGCTGMDVAALLRKYKQPLESLSIDAEVTMTEGGYPVVFKSVHLIFRLTGALERERVLEAVKLSQTRYCGVSAMLAKAVPMTYSIELNGEEVGRGAPEFGG
ncbi:MAG: OsmC family protein [Oligoflexia bacterium]|nr:OsmC family protein [Oligoflexia bacterium]